MKNQNGFSLIELIIAMIVLTFGMLAMGSAMGYMSVQVRVADLHTQRAATVAEIGEQLRSVSYDSVVSVGYASAANINGFKIWRRVNAQGLNLKRVDIYTEGPGYNRGWQNTKTDTFTISILRPFQ
jgi:prepilin-type N-terminal cleavage/methylation domain-containing protein